MADPTWPVPPRPRRSTAVRMCGAALAIAVAVLPTLTGCRSSTEESVKIAFLLPESKTSRYEALDRPFFEARIAELGTFEVLYSNADQDASKQQTQAEAALASGASVIVLDPVDSAAAVSIVAAARAQGVPVIAYDRPIEGEGLAYYVSFDNEDIGRLQGRTLLDKLVADDARGGILMVNGSPTDGNAASFKAGAHSVLDGSGFEILAEYDTPDWSPDKAQEWVTGQITQFSGGIAAVYSANDGTASGAIAALKAANVMPLPVVTGQDAELTSIQRIVAGDQYMTIFKNIKDEAELTAEVAVALAKGDRVTAPLEVDGVPATLLRAEVVTIDTIMATVIADGAYTVEEICTPEYAVACAAAGIE